MKRNGGMSDEVPRFRPQEVTQVLQRLDAIKPGALTLNAVIAHYDAFDFLGVEGGVDLMGECQKRCDEGVFSMLYQHARFV
jgi:hypothetical protein